MKGARAIARKRATIVCAWLVLVLAGLSSAGCRQSRVAAVPNSRIIIHRRYSASLIELAGTSPDGLSTIAQWYDARLKNETVAEEEVSATVRKKRWRLADRSLEVIIVDHGKTRTILVREQDDQ